MKIIKNGHILTMNGEEYKNGMIVFDEKIIYVGEEDNSYTADEVIDAEGMIVMPGLVDSHSHLGMFEDSIGFEGDDGNEDSDPITPHLRAIDGINPFDRGFEEAYNAGVTTVVTGPGSANPVGGQFAAIKTYGICTDDMVIKAPAAMKFALGENPKTVYNEKNEAPVTRMGTAALIRELMFKAKNYQNQLEKHYADTENNDKPEYDMKLEAMLPVLKKEIPVKIHAHRADDICTAIRLGKEFDIDITIEHCTDGDRIKEILKRENIPVNLGPTFGDRSKAELKSLNFSTYKNLSELGIDTSIITDHPEITEGNLPLCAVMAVKNGMDTEKALLGITATAAKNCRIDDRVGSLKEGLDADIAVFTQLPTVFDAECKMVFINGKRVK